MQPLKGLLTKIVSTPLTLTLAVENPRIKPALVKKIVEGLVSLGEITYFDYDLQFSSSLQNVSEEMFSDWVSRGLTVLQPGDDPFDLVAASTYLSKMKRQGVFILDSINTLQVLLSENNLTQAAKEANYKSSILLSVLQLTARSFSKSFIVFDLTKLRPRVQIDRSISWEKELVGGRMIRYKSDMILFASEAKDSAMDKSGWTSKRIQLLPMDENAEGYSVDL